MLYIYLRGGLGNQLFQLCYGFGVARELGQSVQIVDHYYTIDESLGDTHRESYFDTIYSPLASLRNTTQNEKVLQFPLVTETSDLDAMKEFKHVTVSGWFQRWTLIQPFISSFRDQLIKPRTRAPPNSIGIHFRYGDMVSKYAHVYHAQSIEYYRHALQRLQSTLEDHTSILLFCQPCDWVDRVEVMVTTLETEFPTLQFTRVQLPSDWEELLYMSTCHALVTTNSTFSTWAAILGNVSNVVCPKKWYHNEEAQRHAAAIYPPEWTIVE